MRDLTRLKPYLTYICEILLSHFDLEGLQGTKQTNNYFSYRQKSKICHSNTVLFRLVNGYVICFYSEMSPAALSLSLCDAIRIFLIMLH